MIMSRAPVLGRIPADAQCLRNLGCQGGPSLEELSTLGKAEKRSWLATRAGDVTRSASAAAHHSMCPMRWFPAVSRRRCKRTTTL